MSLTWEAAYLHLIYNFIKNRDGLPWWFRRDLPSLPYF